MKEEFLAPLVTGVLPDIIAIRHPEGVIILGMLEKDSSLNQGRYLALHLSYIHAKELSGKMNGEEPKITQSFQ